MPISANFKGEFSEFYTAVDKATGKLVDFGDGATKVGTQLNRMVDSFSGKKLIQDATLMVKAIEDVGGVTKLTGKELEIASGKAKEAAEKMRALGMEVPKGLQDVADAGQKGATSFDTLAKSAAGLALGFLSVQAVLALVSKGWNTFVGFMEDSITAASDAEASQSKLIAAMRAQDTAMPSVIALYDDYAAALQETTTFEDDAAQAAMALLVQIGDVMPRDMKKALQASADLSAGLGIDLNQAATMVAKAAQGQTASLNKLGVETKDVTGKTKDFDGVLTAIADKFGGQAAAATNTYAGRIQQLKNAWDDVQESVGRAITTNATVLEAIKLITGAVKTNTDELNQNQAVMNFISDLVILSVRAFALLAEGVANVGGTFASSFRDLEMFTKGLDWLVAAAVKVVSAFAAIGHQGAKAALPGLLEIQASVKGVGDSFHHTIDRTKAFGDGARELAGRANALADQLGKTRGQTVDVTRAQAEVPGVMNRSTKAADDQSDALKKLAAAQKKYADSLRDIVDNLSGGNAIDKATLWMQALDMTIPVTEMTKAKQAELNKVLGDALEAYTALGVEPPAALARLWAATLPAIEATRSLTEAVKDLPTSGITQWATQTVDAMGLLPKGAKSSIAQTKSIFDGLGKTLAGSLGQSVLAAIQGGGSVMGAIGGTIGNTLLDPKQSGIGAAISKNVAKLPGLIGSSLNAVIPMIGSLLGPALELATKGIGKLFGRDEESKTVNPLRDKFVEAAGGIAALNAQAAQAGTTLDAMLKADTVTEYNAAIKDLQTSFDFQKQSIDVAIATAEKYGFTLEELGPALARQELDTQAQQIYKDWEILNAAGIDTVAITTRMADSVNHYVNQAVAMGAEVPEAMRPMLQQMVNMGTLTDASGNKIENLEDSGISFAMTMSQGFEKLIGAVGQLTDAITRGLGVAVDQTSNKLKGMPKQLPVDVVYRDPGFERTHNVEVVYHSTGGAPVEGYQGGTEGFRDFGKGTMVMLHGWEAVVPREEAKSSGGGGALSLLAGAGTGGGGGVTEVVNITINAGGAFFDTPGSLQQLANKIDEALSARHGLKNKRRAA